jgi:hypothetical protein
MKNFLFAILIFFSVPGCNTYKIIPIKGSYASQPIIATSERPFNEVWDRLIDLFAQNGLSIKLIDKSSGLIISDNSAITATWEDKKGLLVHPEAYIVTPKAFNGVIYAEQGITHNGGNKASLKKPSIVRGEWNVRIKQGDKGSLINVNLVNVKYEDWDGKMMVWRNLSSFRSTGLFEKLIADTIK